MVSVYTHTYALSGIVAHRIFFADQKLFAAINMQNGTSYQQKVQFITTSNK
jgi:hypothetical protein